MPERLILASWLPKPTLTSLHSLCGPRACLAKGSPLAGNCAAGREKGRSESTPLLWKEEQGQGIDVHGSGFSSLRCEDGKSFRS